MASYVGISSKNPTKYLGPNVSIVSIVTRNRKPTGADIRQGTTGQYYPIGSYWVISKNPTDGAEGDLWYLSKIVANVAYWIQLAAGGIGPLISFTTPLGSSPVYPSVSGNIDLIGGSGIDITGGTNSITITATDTLFTWTDVTTPTETIVVMNGYITDNVGGVTYTLPATANEGDTFRIAGKLGQWTIAQNAGQQMLIGAGSTTVGVTGTLMSTHHNDAIEFLCTTAGASTIWTALSWIGNLTIN